MRSDSIQSAQADDAITEKGAIVVAHAMGHHPAPLGLDRPIELLGGRDRVAPGGMSFDLGIDHVPGFRNFVASACRRQAETGADWYRQPPLALLGNPGVGKGMVAHWIARHAGLPLYRMPIVSDEDAPRGDAGRPMVRSLPPVPIMAMAASRCANPIIVVEIDMGNLPAPEIEAELIGMMDPRRNSRWLHHDLGTIFDLGHVSWIVQVQAQKSKRTGPVANPHAVPMIPAVLPAGLTRLFEDAGTIIRLEDPERDDELRRLDVAIEACAAAGVDDAGIIEDIWSALKEVNSYPASFVECADLFQLARQMLGSRAQQYRE